MSVLDRLVVDETVRLLEENRRLSIEVAELRGHNSRLTSQVNHFSQRVTQLADEVNTLRVERDDALVAALARFRARES